MPKPTREQVMAELQRLPPEQHAIFLAEVEKRLNEPEPTPEPTTSADLHAKTQASTYQDESGRTLSFPHMGAASVAMDPTTPEGAINNGFMMASGLATALPAAGPVLPALRSAAVGTALAGGAGWLGGEAGERVGRVVGLPGAGRAVGTIAGALAVPAVGARTVMKMLSGGKSGAIRELMQRFAPELAAEEAAAAEAAVAGKAAREAEKAAARAQAQQIAKRRLDLAEERLNVQKARLEMKAQGKPAAAPKPAATAQEIADKAVALRDKHGLSGGQISKSLSQMYGLPPSEADQIAKGTVAGLKEAEKAAAANALQPERIQVGAQKVGKGLGMTKEEVRLQAGPVLDEALGEASPILPKQALTSIIDKMKALPPGAAREAYVAAATSGKTKWQVENIRRTLEHLGLLVPLGAVAGAAAQGER